nr:hypothetical protein [uncultured Cohaesibacter sp.]
MQTGFFLPLRVTLLIESLGSLMSKSKILINAVLIILFASVIGGLFFYFSKPTLSEQMETCLAQADYSCLVELAYKNPPELKADMQKRKAAISLAYLGKTEKAFDFYKELAPDTYRHKIVGAILTYLTMQDRADEIDAYVNKVPNAADKLAALNDAWSTLRNSNAIRLHPDYLKPFATVLDTQLEKLAQSTSLPADLRLPYSLSRTHKEQILAIANLIEEPSARSKFKQMLEKSHQKQIKKDRELKDVEQRLLNGETQTAIDKISEYTRYEPKPELDHVRFGSFIGPYYFFSYWLKITPDIRDRFAEAFTSEADTWSDPACQAGIYSDLALIYALVGNRDKSLELLDRFIAQARNRYQTTIKKSFCLGSGYFAATVLQYLLGDSEEIDRDDYVSQFVDGSSARRIELETDFKFQANMMLHKAISFSTHQSRERLARLSGKISKTLVPELHSRPKSMKPAVISDPKSGLFVKITPTPFTPQDTSFLNWALESGDLQQAVSIITMMYDEIKANSKPGNLNKTIQEALLTRIISDEDIEDGLLWSTVSTQPSN